MTRRVKLVLAVAALSALALSVGANVPFRLVIHSIEVTGAPGRTVDFFTYRSALDSAIGRNGGYFVRFPNGAETKLPIVPGDVSPDELRQGSSAEYDGEAITVRGPQGRSVSLRGYRL